MENIKTGYLVIADITGFTAFLNQSELEHAQDSLNSLLGLLVEYTRQPLLVSHLEGDAVLSYALAETVPQGQILVDLVENTYLAFRKARELMVVNTTCSCRACLNIPHLDLKFFLHHGSFAIQEIADNKELLGNDVNLIHRLTKNSIVETTGIQAYAAYTQAAVDALGINEISAGFIEHTEQYEFIGDVSVLVQDLTAVWQRDQETLRFTVRPEETLYRIEADFPLPPTILWHYITDPQHRAVVHGSEWQRLVAQPDGRIGLGAVYECAHGNYISRNTVVDWHPFEQYTTYETTPIPRTHVYVTYLLAPLDSGTRLSYVCSQSYGPYLLRKLSDLGGRRIIPQRFKESFAAFQAHIEQEFKGNFPHTEN